MTAPVTATAGPVTCSSIEAALAEQRRALQPPDADHPPVRMSTLTLVVLATSDAGAAAAEESLATLKADHPSRTLTFVMAPGEERDSGEVRADVTVSMEGDRSGPDGGLLAEQVRLSAAGAAGQARLSGMLAPLLLPDIPAFVWVADWPAAERILARSCEWLLDEVDLAIFDTAAGHDSPAGGGSSPLAQETANPAACLAALAALDHATGRDLGVADLAWVRVEPWRELVAQFFDPAALRPLIGRVSTAEITYEESPARRHGVPSTDALLLGGWLHAHLPSSPRVSFREAPAKASTPGWIGGVTLEATTLDGAAATFRIDWADDRARVTTEVPGQSGPARLVRLPVVSRAELLGRRLHAPVDDPVYRAALQAAVTLSR